MNNNTTAQKSLDMNAYVPRHNEKLYMTKQYSELARKVELMQMAVNKPVLLVGHAGVGKNQVISEVAHKLNKPLIRVSCSGDMRVSSLLGRLAPNENGVITFQDGLITLAVRNGAWLVLDEINSLDSDILFALHGLLDDGMMTIANNSEIIKAHPDFRLFATMNPQSYYGVKTLNQALVDRFAVMTVDFDKEIDNKIMDELEQPNEVKTAFKNIIANVRAQFAQGDITQNFGHRTLSNVVEMSKHFDLMEAIDMSYTNKLPESERSSFQTIAKDLVLTMKELEKEAKKAKKANVPTGTPTGQISKDQAQAYSVDDLANMFGNKP